MAVDSAEEDLIELLSCHRSDAWFNQKAFHQVLHGSTCEFKIVRRPVLDRCDIQESEGPFPWSSTICNPGDRKKNG